MALRRHRDRVADDLTPEQREARIAELRARRHARRRKLAIRSALGSLGLVVFALVAGWWLLSTIGGRDFLLAQVRARLPEGTELSWARADGPLRGPITLENVRFVSRGCPAVNGRPVAYPDCEAPRVTTFTAQRIVVDPAIRPLFGRRLRLDALDVSDATLDLPDADEPFELPRWPDALPQIAPPLAMRADTIRVDRLRVTRQGAALIDLQRVRGGLDASEGRLRVERLVVDSDLGRFTAHGDYAPRDDYRTDLAVTAVFPRAQRPLLGVASPLRATPPRLALVARGDLARMDVGIGGAVPRPLRASLTLRGADAPRWSLRARTDGLDPAVLAGREPSPAPMVFDLRADGTGGRARLQGRFAQGGLRATVRPSTLVLEDQVLAFEPLVLDVFDGRVTVRGRGDFGDRGARAPLKYAVVARGLRFGGAAVATPAAPAPTAAPQIGVDADFGIAGTRARWAAIGEARIARASASAAAGAERATVRLDGRGKADGMTLRTLQARMPTGTLDATGRVDWSPALAWKLDATLDGFDPGYFAPGWHGDVDAALATQGRARDAGGFDATAAVTGIGGRLRGRALSGSANATAEGDTYRGNVLLGVGSGRLQGKGTYTAGSAMRWQADATLRGFDPGLVLEEWNGAVDAVLTGTGARRDDGALAIAVDAARLGGTLRGRRLSGRGDVDIVLPVRGGPRFAGELAVGMGASRVEAKGTVADALDVDAQFAPLQLDDFLPGSAGSLRGTLRLTGARNAPNVAADLTGAGLRFGDYRADTLTARGRLPWRGGGGDLTLRAQGLVAGIAFDTLRVQARGAVENLQFEGEAQGAPGRLALGGSAVRRNGNWSGTLQSLQLDPQRGADWRLTAPARYAQNGSAWTLSRSCFASSQGGSLCADAQWPGRGLALAGEGLPLALAEAYLPEPADGRRWRLNGEIALEARVRPAGNAWAGTARVRSATGGLRMSARARNDLVGYRDLILDAQFDPQRLRATLASGLSDGGRVDARIATGWDGNAPLSGEVAIDTQELTWLELFSPDIVDPTGRLAGRVALGGTRGAPTLGGQAQLSGFAAEVPALNIALSNGDFRMSALADGSARITGGVRSGDGTLNVDGSLNWRSGDAPLVLNLRGRNVLASDTRDVRAVVDPDVVVRAQAGQPLTVTGTVTVPEAMLELERLDDGVSASSDVVVLDPANPEAQAATPLALDLTLAMGDDVRLQGFGLDGQLGGRLRVRSVPGREMTGSGSLEIEGRYEAYGQELEITRGRLVWSNTAIADPVLDIRAQRELGDVVAGIAVTGRASAPEANVYSNQSGSQSDALAYLTLGRPLSGLSGDEARDVSAASAALSAGGSVLASQLGARIGLDDAGVLQSRTAGSVFGVGKYLSPRLYVGYGVSLLGTGQVVMLKYLLRKGFDVQIESSSIENRGSINYRREK
jgi:translocation and assembly module TamB